MVLKIDTEKAFDTLEWSFLLNVLLLHGFSNTWVNWISQCISTPSFSIQINGSPFGFFKSSRGLHQVTLCPHFCLLLEQISFPSSFSELNQLVLCKASKSLLTTHRFHIYNLQMISLFSLKQTPQMQPPFSTA